MNRGASFCGGRLAIWAVLGLLSSQALAGEGGGAVLEVRAEAKPDHICFGDPLRVVVTVKNGGGALVELPPGGLELQPAGWHAEGRGGTGPGNSLPLVLEKPAEESAVLRPGGSVAFVALVREVTVLSMGPMKAEFVLQAKALGERRLPPGERRLTVEFEVGPSALMSAIRKAKEPAEREKLRPEIRDLLRLRAAARNWRDSHYVEGVLDYTASAALPLLEEAARDADPVVRAQAIEAYRHGVWSVGNLNAILDDLRRKKLRPAWIEGLEKSDPAAPEKTCNHLALAGLKDSDAGVRRSAVRVLTWRRVEAALNDVKALTSDPDASVREAALDYLKEFAAAPSAADAIVASLADPDPKVQDGALAALERSPKPPPLPLLRQAFGTAKGEPALRLLALLVEREDADLPAALLPGFAGRSPAECLAILAAVAGHRDAATLDLVKLGLRDPDAGVQRAALLRLLAFPKETTLLLVEEYARTAPAELAGLAAAVRSELAERRLFPFLGGATAAKETEFPSRNGTVPMVSPDGKWLAYVETGWGRPGGTGGFGRSNLPSIVHVVRVDGTDDRVVSDMFLVGWLADSRRIGSARDGYAAVSDLDGNIVGEFGEPVSAEWQKYADERVHWRKRELRQQMGSQMPHRKRLAGLNEMSFGENGAFSPDGKQYGPLVGAKDEVWLLDADGATRPLAIPEEPLQPPWKVDPAPDGTWALKSRMVVSVRQALAGGQAVWSPDGRRIALVGPGHAPLVLEAPAWRCGVIEADPLPRYGDWDYRKCRWNPWSKDGSRLAFLRQGQVWIAAPDGSQARQLTFDGGPKAWPTLSRDGQRVAYVAWQPDSRVHYSRIGPTDLWVVDVVTTLAVRATAPSPARIYCLDWLNEHEVIFDRVEHGSLLGYKASLRRLDLRAPAVVR